MSHGKHTLRKLRAVQARCSCAAGLTSADRSFRPVRLTQVRGYGLSGDAHHITQPPPDGIGAQLAMQRALRQAGLAPQQVCYINAHATSTPQGTVGFPLAAAPSW